MYPMKMKPVYKNYLWGGTRLNEQFHKDSVFLKTAESWELSCCSDGLSIIANGTFRNQTLYDVLQKNTSFISSDFRAGLKFPLLIKLIDASDRLSIQVHPSDELADKSKGQQGKTEAWYILDCEKDAFLYIGLKETLTEDQLREYVINGTICEHLNKVFVKPGDLFFISSGTIHAIGAGILIAEIQQNSNTTFRLFDYDRVDSSGNKREIHIDDAVRVSNKNKYILSQQKLKNLSVEFEDNKDYKQQELVKCKYFNITKYISQGSMVLDCKKNSFQALLFTSGHGSMIFNSNIYEFNKGDCYFIPAGMGEYEVEGFCEFLLSEV